MATRKHQRITMLLITTPLITMLPGVLPGAALAQTPTARVGDVTRLQGLGTNRLIGYGLVTGLQGTGDGSKFVRTVKDLKAMMERFSANVESLDEISGTKNVATVMIEVVIPEHGAREGDQLDVYVTAIAAKSLAGGRLLSTPLLYHDPTVKDLFGFAAGKIELNGSTDTHAIIRGGARMERDVLMSVVARGGDLHAAGIISPWIQSGQTYITLVLDDAHAGWSMAAAIAQAVDKELSISADVDRVALAVDSKSVVVLLPEHQRRDVASWIRDVERTPILMESNGARVTINRAAGTIVVTGDTKLSPVIISQRGLTVTVTEPPPTDDGAPATLSRIRQERFVAVDVERNRLSSVHDLLEALNRLNVSFEDRVSILEQIHRAGKLHAKVLYEG